MDWINELADKLLQFAALPVGGAILVLVLLGAVLIFLIWFASIRLRGRQLEFSEARSRREADLEQAKLKTEENEDIRRSATNAQIATAIQELVKGRAEDRQIQSRIVSILERMEAHGMHTYDVVKVVKDNTDALSIRTAAMHKDVRQSAVTLAGKLDSANNESRSRWESTQIAINNRAQETQKTVHATANDVQTTLTKQDALLDQVLQRLGDVLGKVDGLAADIRANTTAKAHATEQITEIKTSVSEILAGVVLLKKRSGTGNLNPAIVDAAEDKLALPTAHGAVSGKEAEPPISHISKRDTGKFPPPTPTIEPVVNVDISKPITGTFATPTTTGNEETQKLDMSKIMGDTSNV